MYERFMDTIGNIYSAFVHRLSYIGWAFSRHYQSDYVFHQNREFQAQLTMAHSRIRALEQTVMKMVSKELGCDPRNIKIVVDET